MVFGKKGSFVRCRRRSTRQAVMLAGSAMSVTRSRSVMITDLSAEGAGIVGRDLPSTGDDLLMVAGSTDRMGKVVWRNAGRCGIELDRPLHYETVEQMKLEAAWDEVIGWVQ